MISYTRFAKIVLFVAVVSAVINAGLAYIGIQVSHPPVTFGPYMYSRVISFTVVGVIAAALVYIVVRRLIAERAKADRWFLYISAIALLVSFYPDIAFPWSTDEDDIGWTYGIMANLMLMHVVAAGFVMKYFITEGKQGSSSASKAIPTPLS